MPLMKDFRLAVSAVALLALCCMPPRLEAKRDLADYTLRLSILGSNWNHNGFGYHAVGRANLFDDQGTPHAVEFTYDCEDHLMASSGVESYPAKWKKPGQTLEVIFGQIGDKPNSFHSCEFKVAEKNFVFVRHNGELGTESVQEFLADHKNQLAKVGPPAPDEIPVSANPHR